MRAQRLVALALMAGLAVMAVSPATMQANHLSTGNESQPVWFEWNRHELHILIVPPQHGQIFNSWGIFGGPSGTGTNELTPWNSYLDAVEDAIGAWDDAIQQYAEPWLKDNLNITHSVWGRDVINPGTQFNIVFFFDETKLSVLGVAVSTHPCIANSSMWLVQSFSANDMFNVAGHEIGHCLGLDHSSFGHDILHDTYQYNIGGLNPRLCPSNLNVDTLHGVFARTLNQPSARWGADGEVGPTKDMGEYARVSC